MKLFLIINLTILYFYDNLNGKKAGYGMSTKTKQKKRGNRESDNTKKFPEDERFSNGSPVRGWPFDSRTLSKIKNMSFNGKYNPPDYELSNTEKKREEYRSTHKSLQFFYILSQLGILDLIEERYAKILLKASHNETPYQVHHLFPLGLGGTNDFNNLCLMDKDLHTFVHNYCLSQKAVKLIESQPIEERKKYMERFVPSFAPIARAETFFNETVVRAAKSCVYSASIDTLKQQIRQNKMPISSDNVRASFSEQVIRKCEFNSDAFDYLVRLYISDRLSSSEEEKDRLKSRISRAEEKLLCPSGKYSREVEEIREKYENPTVWQEKRHNQACSLIARYAVPPIVVLTEDRLKRTERCINKNQWHKIHQ